MITISSLKKMLENRNFGQNIIIPKSYMQRIPVGCSDTFLGDPNGASRQYRCDHNIHILEYLDRYKVHKDRVDPREDPVGHLIHDSPEALAGLGVGSLSGIAVGKIIYDKREDKSKNDALVAVIGGFLTAIITGVCTYYFGKSLKNRGK